MLQKVRLTSPTLPVVVPFSPPFLPPLTSSSGIGYACAQALGASGAKLVLADIDPKALSHAESSLKSSGYDAISSVCDVTDKSQIECAIQAAIASYGSLDIAVANAGIVRSADFLDMSEADFDDVINVNLKGTFLTCQLAARQMVAQHKEVGTNSYDTGSSKSAYSIITMSSFNAKTAIANISSYNASKGAINNLTRSMALALAPHNIRVNAVGPGSIMTDLLKKVAHDEKVMHKILSRTPMLRVGEPIEVGNVVKFLASDDASYITGQVIYVDGGRDTLNYTVDVPY